jgi:hypothetical protein
VLQLNKYPAECADVKADLLQKVVDLAEVNAKEVNVLLAKAPSTWAEFGCERPGSKLGQGKYDVLHSALQRAK